MPGFAVRVKSDTTGWFVGCAGVLKGPAVAKIIIIEQNQYVREALGRLLAARADYQDCMIAVDGQAAPAGAVRVVLAQAGESTAEAQRVLYKPLRAGALLDNLAQLLSQPGMAADIPIGGDYVLSLKSQDFISKKTGRSVRLTDKECLLLKHLADAVPDGLDRRSLLDLVWGYAESAETHTLETHIYRLRQKIETDPARPEILLTTAVGYRISLI